MAVPNLNARITGRIAGDDLDMDISVDVPSGQTLVKAWLTVKEVGDESDSDTMAIFQKIITTAIDMTKGVIGDAGAGGTALLSFYCLPADTILLTPGRIYAYDVQAKSNLGIIGTSEKGTIQMEAGVTVSTA